MNIPKHRELAAQIAELTELLEELRSEKAMVLQRLQCVDDRAVSNLKKIIFKSEMDLKNLEKHETRYAAALETALKQYTKLQEQAADLDPLVLYQARQAIRPEKEQSVVGRVQSAYGDKYSLLMAYDSKREVSKLLNEYTEDRAMQELKREQQRKIQREQLPQPRKKKFRDDWER